MPLNDVDLVRRRTSIGHPVDLVDFIVYTYNEHSYEEIKLTSVIELINLLKQNNTEYHKCFWIEIINRSSMNLPRQIHSLCKYLDIHPLTMEDLSTLAPSIKLDLFPEQSAVYVLMKIITWNGERVEQQQISFYFQPSKNLLLTFQEKSLGEQSYFDHIRTSLRSQNHSHNRLKHTHIDYLFYSLFNMIIDRSLDVIESIASKINHYDVRLMSDKKSLNSDTFHSIYRLKHDLIHLRILFIPLREIINRLERTTLDEDSFLHKRSDEIPPFNIHDRLVRSGLLPHQSSSNSLTTTANLRSSSRRTSVFFNKNTSIYLRDLNDHVTLLINSIQIQRESVSNLLSLWLSITRNETQRTLKFLTLISALFISCMVFLGIFSTNFENDPLLHHQNSYFIFLGFIASVLLGMITWYKLKGWF